MRYLIALMLAVSICLGGCDCGETKKEDNQEAAESETRDMPPPVEYDEELCARDNGSVDMALYKPKSPLRR